ncbi:MAG: MMPL family transporter, partial [Bacillota bacterium]|nr:MMPL family transporter [Bacillota bacterium]
MLPKNNRALQLSTIYDREDNFGPSNAVMIAIESPDIFGLDTLKYIKKLDYELAALNTTIPVKQMSRLLGLSEDEGARVVEGLRAVGINDLNYDETLVKLLRSPEALQSRLSLSAELAARISKAAVGVPGERLFSAYDNPMGKIQSLVNADYIAYEDDSLVARKLVDGEEIVPEKVNGLKDRVASWDSYEGMIVSKDRTLTCIVALIKSDDKYVKAEINDELVRITQDPPAGMRVHVAGESVVIDHLGKAMMKDIPNLVVVVLVTLVVLLLFCFKTAKGIIYPMLNTFVAVIWTLGLMGFTGVPLTIVGAAITPLLMAIVSAYGIHQINHYYSDPRTEKFTILEHNAKSVGLAILLSGITVMVGFGALYAQDFVPIQQFGLFTAFGDLVGVVGALLVLPALLMIGNPKKGSHEFQSEGSGKHIANFLHMTNSIVKGHPRAIFITTTAICLIMAAFSSQVKSDIDIVKFFTKSDSIRESTDLLNARMAGTKDLAIILDSDLRDPVARKGNPDQVIDLANPEVLQRMDRFSTDVRKKFPFVTKVVSFADALKKMNQELNGGDPSFYAIPSDPALISQYLMIFSGDTKSLMTVNHDKFRIMLAMNGGSIEDTHRVALYSQEYFDTSFQKANHAQVLISGYQNLIYEAN